MFSRLFSMFHHQLSSGLICIRVAPEDTLVGTYPNSFRKFCHHSKKQVPLTSLIGIPAYNSSWPRSSQILVINDAGLRISPNSCNIFHMKSRTSRKHGGKPAIENYGKEQTAAKHDVHIAPPPPKEKSPSCGPDKFTCNHIAAGKNKEKKRETNLCKIRVLP